MTAEEIEQLLSPYFDIGWPVYLRCDSGWYPLIKELHEKIVGIDPKYKIHQIKEKFGELRYYFLSPEYWNEVHILVDEYSSKSKKICEVCGKPGHTSRIGGYWLKTVCFECYTDLTKDKDNSIYNIG